MVDGHTGTDHDSLVDNQHNEITCINGSTYINDNINVVHIETLLDHDTYKYYQETQMNKKPTNWWGRQNAAPLKFDSNQSEAAFSTVFFEITCDQK